MGNLNLLRPNIFGEKKQRNPPGGHVSGWTCRTRVDFFRVYLLKRRGHLNFRAEKCVICLVAFNYLVSGR